ncbi:hypothetical protein V2J09_000121 [Rumex salicifolius]
MITERTPEPLDFFIWTVEVVLGSNPAFGIRLEFEFSIIKLEEDDKPIFSRKDGRLTQFLCISQLILDDNTWLYTDVGLWLDVINLGSYREIFKENGVNGEYLEGMSMFTTEQILRFIRRCHMKWGDFITLCKELRRIKVACLKGGQKVCKPWWAPSCLSPVFGNAAKRNRQCRFLMLVELTDVGNPKCHHTVAYIMYSVIEEI